MEQLLSSYLTPARILGLQGTLNPLAAPLPSPKGETEDYELERLASVELDPGPGVFMVHLHLQGSMVPHGQQI